MKGVCYLIFKIGLYIIIFLIVFIYLCGIFDIIRRIIVTAIKHKKNKKDDN